MLTFCLAGFLAACFSTFINYCLGKPGSDHFSPYEIFSSYTVWLSKLRLKKLDGLYYSYKHQFDDDVKGKSLFQVITMKADFRKLIYEAAEPYFRWEKAFGMCPVCTGFWISLFFGTGYLVFYTNFWNYESFFNLLIIIVISHVTIRVFQKIL